MSKIIRPFIGVDNYKLLSNEKEIVNMLKTEKVSFEKEIWSNEECTVKEPWTVLRADNSMSFFFAKDKLFKIFMQTGFDGALPNGISIGTDIEDAQKTDKTLRFDDWNEDWASDEGYWLEDDIDTKNIISITIFIKELLDDDLFDKYEW